MAAVCQVTGAVPGFGHSISHSHRRTKRRFDPNVQKKTYFVPSLGRKVTLNIPPDLPLVHVDPVLVQQALVQNIFMEIEKPEHPIPVATLTLPLD